MISPKTQLNLQHAKQYFREHLAVGDYSAVRTADYSAEKNRLRGE
jgi:LEA14-like dessication related protein